MRIWIVGKNGLLASAFARICEAKKIPYRATSRSDVDCTDAASIAPFVKEYKPTLIINCAAYTSVDLAETNEKAAYQLNVLIPKHLAETGLPLVHFSTDYVFDGLSNSPYTEESAPQPINVYGKTKREGEKEALQNPHTLLVRVSWLFGKEGNHFVRTMQHLLGKKDAIQVVNDQWGRPTFADDVVHATLALVEKKARGIFHCANEGETTWYSFAASIKEIIGASCDVSPIPSEDYPQAAQRPKHSVLSTAKLEKTLGVKLPLWQNRVSEIII